MGRHSCCVKQKLRKGLWSPEEDEKLYNYITRFGVGCWSSVPKLAGLQRCGKSCRLRWINYLRPDLKRGMFSQQEENLIISLHEVLGNSSDKAYNLQMAPQSKGVPTVSPFTAQEPTFLVNDSPYYTTGLTDNTKEQFMNKQIYDPFSGFEFQATATADQTGYNSNLVSQYHNGQFETNNSNFAFSSMPSLTSFDHGNMSGADFSDNSASRVSSFFLNEAKESSSNSSNMSNYTGFQVNNMLENAAAFSWDAENKLNSMFQFHVNGIKSEEMTPSSWHEAQLHTQNSVDFSSYPLTSLSEDLTGANFDVFHQI
ncbi:hypothetical protein Patl1_18115 [Pistacia atlantica]|uniref:Uncharacterized protein n=1 Tax=Pistacia atlantica TaxID=434234 RepID=A0ACC1BXK2_9ROSI|nr:hypothetical protein Patl1_18115 [Pistacia atlantica]